MLLTKEVEVGLASNNIKYYEELGYEIPREIDKYGKLRVKHGMKIKVKIEQLQRNSEAKVDVLCDYCKENISQKTYKAYMKTKDEIINKDCCAKCQPLKCIESNLIKYGVENMSQREDIKIKKELTNMKHWGVLNYQKSKDYKENHTGENHWNWQGGLKSEDDRIRNTVKYEQWRKQVFQRDNFTCQCCGDNKGHNLEAHHIKNFKDNKELRFDINNGITLCNDCHNPNRSGSFHYLYGTKNNTQEQLEEYMIRMCATIFLFNTNLLKQA